MLAARLHGREDLRIEDVEEPEPGPDEVKIAVAHNGLCGTDVHQFFAGPLGDGTPHPLTGAVGPQIMGHELSGVVSAIGDGVSGIGVGDRVCVEPIYTCGECDRCRSGLRQLCRLIGGYGITSNGGGLSQWTVVPEVMVHALSDSLSLEQGALIEPMSVAFNGVLQSRVEPGQTGLVFGAGPIGIGAFLGMRAVGVEDVIVVEPSPARRAAIEALGVVETIDPRAIDVAQEVLRRTGGRGVDASIDCAGVPDTFALGPLVTRARGRYVVIALFEEPVTLNPFVIQQGDTEVVGSLSYEPGVFDRVIELMADCRYPTTGWVEHIEFEQLIPEGLEALRRGERMKVLVDLP
jgi:(R,R)-butanediol dehydrogenase / meso-butanediol dehydrogenase / diacetyl reductase